MTPLTPKEQAVFDLRHNEDQGYQPSFDEIGASLGITGASAKTAYSRGVRKLGNPDLPGRNKNQNRNLRIEVKNPEISAELIDKLTDPGESNITKAARECGLPLQTAQQLAKRVETEYLPVKKEVERIKTDSLVRKFETLAYEAVNSITMDELKDLDAYKRTLVAAIATDKRELLDGRPTERISIDDRRALPEMMLILEREARRRGLMRDRDPETGAIKMIDNPSAPPRAVRENREQRLDWEDGTSEYGS